MSTATSYDDDLYLWSREQADLVRGLAARRRDLPNALDLANIAEEIESVGRSDLKRVESQLVLIMAHLIKLASHGFEAAPSRGWNQEILAFHDVALRRVTPGMKPSLDLQALWVAAVRMVTTDMAIYGETAPALPPSCPFDFADLLDQAIDIPSLVDRLAPTRL